MTDKCQIKEKWTRCEIKLRKKSAITAASIQPGDDRGNVRNVRISAHSDAGWVQIGKRFMVKTPVYNIILLFPVFFCSALKKSDKVKYERLVLK